ncbi:MAG: hypothetical protein VSS52_008840, partial [Thiotrichaceae bacterium]|nr:hypothetical protein [Thiotrichaceae bacterium]
MKKLFPAIVLVKDIYCDVARQQFSEEKLDIAARLILNIKGIISPIIVSRVGVENYQVIHGDFEYHAAMRAREIDPIRGESIDAYIVNAETEETIQKQIQVFRGHQQPPEPTMNNSSSESHLESLLKSCLQPVMDKLTHLQPIMDRLTEIENRLSIQDVPVEIPAKPVEQAVQQEDVPIDSEAETPSQEIETPTPLSENQQEDIEKVVPEPIHAKENVVSEIPELIPAYLQLINELPSDTLAEKLKHKQLRINKSVTKAILENKPFESEKALSSVKGVGGETIKKLKILPTLSDSDVSEPVAVKTKPKKQAVPP